MPDQRTGFVRGAEEVTVSYRSTRDGSFRFGDGTLARIHAWSADGIDVEIDGRRSRARITRHGDRILVQSPHGDVDLAIVPRFVIPGAEMSAGGFVAAMPGKVIDLRVRVGDRVSAGDTVLVLEAMKMEHPMRAVEDGTVVEVRVELGDQVESGALLLVVQTDAEADTEANENESKGDA
jgi:propionyl-CoA carboxylase alpha chain